MKTTEYEKCKICKHVCYDEDVTTCNHPIGFGPEGECPIYGDPEEEAECFMDAILIIDAEYDNLSNATKKIIDHQIKALRSN